MSVRTYSTDEKCPNCGVNILESLRNHVYSEGGKDFEYECPSCGHGLEITVEPVPAFSISRLERPNTGSQRTVCTACETELSESNAYCPTCGLWNPNNRR